MHALSAVHKHGLGVLDLHVESADRRAVRNSRNKTRMNAIRHRILERVTRGLGVRGLSDGMVVGPELELNNVSRVCLYDLRIEEQRLLTSRATDDNGDDLGRRGSGARCRRCLTLYRKCEPQAMEIQFRGVSEKYSPLRAAAKEPPTKAER